MTPKKQLTPIPRFADDTGVVAEKQKEQKLEAKLENAVAAEEKAVSGLADNKSRYREARIQAELGNRVDAEGNVNDDVVAASEAQCVDCHATVEIISEAINRQQAKVTTAENDARAALLEHFRAKIRPELIKELMPLVDRIREIRGRFNEWCSSLKRDIGHGPGLDGCPDMWIQGAFRGDRASIQSLEALLEPKKDTRKTA